MRVCYFGTYRFNYSRNVIMIEGLRRNGVEVIECHESLWSGIEDRVAAASGRWLSPMFLVRVLRVYTRLIWRYLRLPAHDLVVVGYPGQFDVFLARFLARLRGVPLVWDIFMSIYLIAVERNLDRRSRFTVGLLRRIERLACRLPDRLILDTADYVAWFESMHGVSKDRFRLVPTGADDRAHAPAPLGISSDGPTRVLYYGTFIRNHGVLSIIEAARLLRDDAAICFEMVGEGPERAAAVELVGRYGLTNIVFSPWLEKEQLQERIAQADICLGVFGDTPQSLMTVQNKIYEGLAAGKPVLTGDAPAVRRAFQHGTHLYLVERGNPAALAEAVRFLAANLALRQRLATFGHAEFAANYTIAHIGERFAAHLRELVRV